LLNLGESTLQWTFLDVIISNFFQLVKFSWI
jgi:hypothetical protein